MASQTGLQSSFHSVGKHKLEKIPDSIFYVPDFITEAEESELLRHVNEAPKPKWTHLSNRRLQNWGGLPHPRGMVQEPLPPWLEKLCKRIADLGVFGVHTPNHVLVNEYRPGQGIMPHTDGPLYYPIVSTINLGGHTVLKFFEPINNAEVSKMPAIDEKETSKTDTTDCGTKCIHGDRTCDTEANKSGQMANNTGDSVKSSEMSDRHLASVLLQPRSLVLVCHEMYKTYLHGIDELKSDVITEKCCNIDKCPNIQLGDTLPRSTRVSLTIRHVPKVLKTKLFLAKK